MLNFEEIIIPNPTYDKIASEYEALHNSLGRVKDADSRIAIVEKWDQLCRRLYTWYYFVELKFKQDTSNEEFKAILQYRDEFWPEVTELEIAMKRRLLQDPFRGDIEARFNKHITALWDADILVYEPIIKDDLIQESKSKAQYTELRSEAKLQFRGETYSFSGIGKFCEDKDRNIRHESQKTKWNWVTENGGKFDSIFDDLVKQRTEIAQKLGYANYIDFAYKKWKRIGYDQTHVEKYRQEVLKHVVPLTRTLHEKQRIRLGLKKLYVYDAPLFSLQGNPEPQDDHDFIIARATEMFDDLGTEMSDFFQMMKNCRLFDLKAQAHPECFYLPSYEVPYIFANFNGTMHDIETFIHEMGHAFQYYCSRKKSLLDYQSPTWDSCEIHAMSLEFLTYPFMEKFFGDQGAQQYRQIHLTKALQFLPYGVAIDHFQHLVYANPTASPSDRHAMWKKMENLYLPDWDWDDLKYGEKGGRWQLTPHIYMTPMFYIEYTLAQCCAMQFWLKSESDFKETLNSYIRLCKSGGEISFQDLINSANLNNPFSEGSLSDVVKHAYQLLDS